MVHMAENQNLWPFENLKTNELVQELIARKIKIEKPTKKDMEIKLRKAMGAHIRTPTLSFKNESKPITNLNLKNYEVSPIEVLLKLDASCTN